MDQKYTIEEVLTFTVDSLKNITIPCEMARSVGIPVANAIANINSCINSIKAAKVETESTDNASEESK